MTTKRAGALSLDPNQKPGDWVMRELPARVVVFLRGVGSHAAIRAAMHTGGYGPRDHEEGLSLLLSACPYRSIGFDPAEDEPARKAVAELETWVRTHGARLRAALERLHPEQLGLLSGIDASGEARAVLAVATSLERLNTAEATSPKSPVFTTLEQRGFDRAARQRLEQLVKTAQSAQAPRETPEPDLDPDADLLALYRWFHDWSTTARTFIKRKDWLIHLGLSQRRRTQ